jgi:hypothetical protein
MTDHDTTRRMLDAFLGVLAQRPPLGYGHWSQVWHTDGGPELFAAAFTAAEAARWQPAATCPPGAYVKPIYADDQPAGLLWVARSGWDTHWCPFVPPGPSVENSDA